MKETGKRWSCGRVEMPTLREERYNEQRSHILLAAKTVFARKGFHDASIKDIMKEACVSNGAIFTYFRTKDGGF
jgi:AcrR family transcriptional regulator